jgi:hypothetical protein
MNDPDKAPQPEASDPFMPIVESLLKYPVESDEFKDALSVAGTAERAEALRQINQTIEWELEAQFRVRRRMFELEDED